MDPFFITDTNVVVAGLLTSHAESPVAKILDGRLRSSFRFALSDGLLAEYRGVLLRPKLLKLHQLRELEIEAILTSLMRHAIVLPIPLRSITPVVPDISDQFCDLLTSREDLMRLRVTSCYRKRALAGTHHGNAGICCANIGLMQSAVFLLIKTRLASWLAFICFRSAAQLIQA